MKRALIICLFLMFYIQIKSYYNLTIDRLNLIEYRYKQYVYQQRLDTITRAIFWQESRYKKEAVNGDQVGIGQVRPIMIDELNRLGFKYEYSDRLDSLKTVHMIKDIMSHYNRSLNYECAARIWNGGPNGLKKKSTLKYWLSIKKYISLPK